jgi:hypothetical protein
MQGMYRQTKSFHLRGPLFSFRRNGLSRFAVIHSADHLLLHALYNVVDWFAWQCQKDHLSGPFNVHLMTWKGVILLD